MYQNEGIGAINRAIADFQTTNRDPRAVVNLNNMALGGQPMTVLQLFYDGPEAPASTFDEILAVPAWQGAAMTTSFRDFLKLFDGDLGFSPVT